VVGASVLAVGIWLAADKNSFIQITKLSTLPVHSQTTSRCSLLGTVYEIAVATLSIYAKVPTVQYVYVI
jgi:hypothetical protein